MEFIKEINIDLLGAETGQRRNGKFKVKTLLSRRDRFLADEARRRILGFNPDAALLTLQEEAYVLGQLKVRVIEGPKWWNDSSGGEDLEDGNVIAKVYEEALAAETERRSKLVGDATQAHKSMSKDDKKE